MSRKSIPRFHYLTQDLEQRSHVEQARLACAAGVPLLQLRCKNKAYPEWLEIAREVLGICRQNKTLCLINDSVEIARELKADGVHLGQSDLPVSEARAILGPEAIIGATANAISDLENLDLSCVDYLGVGPYRFTTTKENLKPVLGLTGYQKWSAALQAQNAELKLIAIGGLDLTAAGELLNISGVHGVAVCGAINLASDPGQAAGAFVNLVSQMEKSYEQVNHC